MAKIWDFIKKFFWKIIHRLLKSYKCSLCNAENQQLKDGLCYKCQKMQEYQGYIREYESLKGPKNFEQAKRYFELQSRIANSKGKLEGIQNQSKKLG